MGGPHRAGHSHGGNRTSSPCRLRSREWIPRWRWCGDAQILRGAGRGRGRHRARFPDPVATYAHVRPILDSRQDAPTARRSARPQTSRTPQALRGRQRDSSAARASTQEARSDDVGAHTSTSPRDGRIQLLEALQGQDDTSPRDGVEERIQSPSMTRMPRQNGRSRGDPPGRGAVPTTRTALVDAEEGGWIAELAQCALLLAAAAERRQGSGRGSARIAGRGAARTRHKRKEGGRKGEKETEGREGREGERREWRGRVRERKRRRRENGMRKN